MKRVLTIISTIVFIAVCIWFGWFWVPAVRPLTFRAFAIGQGDSLFVETPARQQILIDAGPGTRVLEKLGRAMPIFDRTIDVAVLTNPDRDHMEGFLEVVKRYHIGTFVMTGVERKEESKIFDDLRALIAERNITVQYVKAGDRLLLEGGIAFSILAPERNLQRVVSDINDSSIVARLDFFHFSVLLTGDATANVERELLAARRHVRANVLKVSHHGSKYSSVSEFLDAVSPDIAVISAGKKNSYGHPSPDVLQRLKVRGIEVVKTSDGDVCLHSDGVDKAVKDC